MFITGFMVVSSSYVAVSHQGFIRTKVIGGGGGC